MPRGAGVPSKAAKPVKSSTDSKPGILSPTFLSRNSSKAKQIAVLPGQFSPSQESVGQPSLANLSRTIPQQTSEPVLVRADSGYDEGSAAKSSSPQAGIDDQIRPASSRTLSVQSSTSEETYKAVLDTFETLNIEDAQSINRGSYFGDSSSLYSKDSASIYSSASSIYSSGASIYSSNTSTYGIEECGSEDADTSARQGSTELNGEDAARLPYQPRIRPGTVRRPEPQDLAARERSTLAKKAAMFKNSRLQPDLPPYLTTLPMWSMVCRAAQASKDCYDSRALLRRGTYTAADTSKDIKAMIVDDQMIDTTQVVIVAIRGTEFRSLADWSVNKAGTPMRPTGLLDDEENECHTGFLQVTKAMISQVATQLRQYPASSNYPSLVFTGHSAGGAIASMLYSHMLSTTVKSDLTDLAELFPSINCVTFGAPPLSMTPLPEREHAHGVFLSFGNEGDPVLRMSNAAYVKSLAKLMTASAPTAVLPSAPVKVVRRSRGTAVVRQTPAAPVVPWEELPLWPTPAPTLQNAGNFVLLRDDKNGVANVSRVTTEELRDVMFGDLAQHTMDNYLRRVKEVALCAMTGSVMI